VSLLLASLREDQDEIEDRNQQSDLNYQRHAPPSLSRRLLQQQEDSHPCVSVFGIIDW
jgi:hypothetical protein